MSTDPHHAESAHPPGWTRLHEEHLPPPTFWPAGAALAITFIFWGLISSWVIVAAGIGLFAVSIAGWIHAILHEGKRNH
jgi:hypothetical protein